MFDLIILIIIDIAFKVLFNNLLESFCLSIGLKIKAIESLLFIPNFTINVVKNYKVKVVLLSITNSSSSLWLLMISRIIISTRSFIE